ncbi:MAG TPA: hypothetical protein VFI11_14880 [Anaerolineales bacterium]|nr:hypothetical protein [Anaerolineales bacterium]
MASYTQAAQLLTQAIEGLDEPYRENTVRWLERCMQHPVGSLEEDLRDFLGDLHPVVRESFLLHTHQLLEDALYYFGRDLTRVQARREPRPSLSQLLAL